MASSPPSGIVLSTPWEVVEVKGKGAVGFLHRLLTQKLDDLRPGGVRPGFLLDHQGRMVSGGYLFLPEEERVWVVTAPGFAQPLSQGLERYRLREPLEIRTREERFFPWILPPPEYLAEEGTIRRGEGWMALPLECTGAPEILFYGHPPGGIPELPLESLEGYRIARGIPAFGKEWVPGVIPLEAGRTHWFHPRKGCYVGQEVIERMWSRKRLARRLARFRLAALPSQLPLPLQGERGVITSAAEHPEEGRIALGYLSARYTPGEPLYDAEGNPVEPWLLPEPLGSTEGERNLVS